MFAYLYFASVIGIVAFTRASEQNETDRSTYISLVNLLKKNNEQLTQLIDLRRNESIVNRNETTVHNDSTDGLPRGKDSTDGLPRGKDSTDGFPRGKDSTVGLSRGKDSSDGLPANGELFEGDLIMTPCLRSVIYGSNRCAGVIANKTWEWDGEVQGIRVPFTIDKNFTFHKTLVKALKEYNRRTCIRFTPRRVPEGEDETVKDKNEAEKDKKDNGKDEKKVKDEKTKRDGEKLMKQEGNKYKEKANKKEKREDKIDIEKVKLMTNAMIELDIKLRKEDKEENKKDNNYKKEVELDTDYVHFANGKGCSSMLGRYGGMQPLFLHEKCAKGVRGVISTLHEMMHVLGMLHEQSRPDRDKYVKVLMKNIIDKHDHNFLKYEAADVRPNHPYNFNSIMHYHNNAFGRMADDGEIMETLIARNDRHMRFGQRAMWSQGDVLSVNQFYCMGRQVQLDYSRKNHTNYKGLIVDAIIKPTLSCEDCKTAAAGASEEECKDCNDDAPVSAYPELDSIREARGAVI